MDNYTNVLSIAGSDPCGCAGIQADIMTGTACGVHVATAITAVTVQNTHCVQAVNPLSPDIVRRQIEIVASDIPLNSVKIGLLPTVEIADTIANCCEKLKLSNIVIDPVGTASAGNVNSGESFSSLKGIVKLLPFAAVTTPNVKEAAALLDEDISDVPLYEVAYRINRRFGAETVVVTNGDGASDALRDGFYCSINKQYGELFGALIPSTNTHGSGCSFSTAIASFLALGFSPVAAIARAEKLIHNLIAAGRNYSFGKGNYGPLGFINLGKK